MPCMLLLSAVDSCRTKIAFLYISLLILSLKLKLSSGVATVFFVGRSFWQAEVCCGYSWPSQDQRCPVSGRSRKQWATWYKSSTKEKKEMTALALTCISADSERSQHVCLFPSAPNSPLTPFKKLICLGHLSKPLQTFREDFRRSRLFLSLIIFTSFHTSMRWAPMKGLNSWSTGQRFLKKNALIEALCGVP